MAVTKANLKQIYRGSIRKRLRLEDHFSASTSRNDDLQASFDDESSSLSKSVSEFASSESEEESASLLSHLVSPNVCKLTDRRHTSLQFASDILNEAASTQGRPSNKRSNMTVC